MNLLTPHLPLLERAIMALMESIQTLISHPQHQASSPTVAFHLFGAFDSCLFASVTMLRLLLPPLIHLSHTPLLASNPTITYLTHFGLTEILFIASYLLYLVFCLRHNTLGCKKQPFSYNLTSIHDLFTRLPVIVNPSHHF